MEKNAFTLVELVVTITILGILATIAFIQVGWYVKDARNSKKQDNLNQISKKIETTLIQGVPIFWFIQDDGTNTLSSISVFWKNLSSNEYKAGTINYTALEIKQDDFSDSHLWGEYKIGAIKDGSKRFAELAATQENSNGDLTGLVVGNYNPRSISDTQSTILSWAGTTKIDVGTIRFQRWDNIVITNSDTSTTNASVVKIQGTVITLNISTNNNAQSLSLRQNESPWLIADKDDTTQSVVHNWTYLPY